MKTSSNATTPTPTTTTNEPIKSHDDSTERTVDVTEKAEEGCDDDPELIVEQTTTTTTPQKVLATMDDPTKSPGFDTIALHGGYTPDKEGTFGLGQGAPRGVPLYRTTPFVFRDTEHAANLFALRELGNIYSRLMNPTTHILESRYALLEG